MRELFSKTIAADGWLKYWSVYIMAFPFYLFPAGSIQPGDLFIMIVLGLFIAKEGLFYKKNFAPHVKNFRNLLVYICVVNFILFIVRIGMFNKGLSWFVVDSFYLFNFLIFCFCFALYTKYGKEFIYTTVFSIVASALLQVVLSPLGNINEGRETLFFTNPNQLGYYSLASLTIILALEKYLKVSRTIIFLSFACFFYFTMLCVSKAAIGGMIILIFIYLVSNKLFSLRTMFTTLVVGVGLLAALLYSETGARFTRNLTYRLEHSVKPKDISEWDYRGYDRMENHPYYMILGAGEGAYNRFDTYIDNHEMHSSLGTILFCYGIPGSIMFIIFIVSLLRGLPWTYGIYMVPLIAYGVAHMGLRFTIFYIALAMFPIARSALKESRGQDSVPVVVRSRKKKFMKPLWQMQNKPGSPDLT
ncbi:MAG: hypothetical protein EOP49_03280 [Sphingobacteriales bacterium]|nr:MAG: hypothetical protein EOP49_03280 [Sphingobacteriales bacterium]